jgi:peptide-methionine (S)-S-oxide reductase
VGYAGGTKLDPTYHSLGDHTETIQIDFDPQVISYQELLNEFWAGHQATRRPWSQQYASLILYANDEQKEAAIKSMAQQEAKGGRTIHTQIRALDRFYNAEGYHQKYQLRQESLLARELLVMFPGELDFINSTAAARVNGYLAGTGGAEQFEKELPLLGLSSRAQEYLRKSFTRNNRLRCS